MKCSLNAQEYFELMYMINEELHNKFDGEEKLKEIIPKFLKEIIPKFLKGFPVGQVDTSKILFCILEIVEKKYIDIISPKLAL